MPAEEQAALDVAFEAAERFSPRGNLVAAFGQSVRIASQVSSQHSGDLQTA